MSLLPAWAPNVHPLVVHFPIALLIAAAIVDLVDTILARPSLLTSAATGLYFLGALGAAAAIVSGQQASETVLMPGMAHPVLADHRTWAISTTAYFWVLVIVRGGIDVVGMRLKRHYRVLLLASALVGVAGVQQTAERGARLVYEYGVGVIGSPGLP